MSYQDRCSQRLHCRSAAKPDLEIIDFDFIGGISYIIKNQGTAAAQASWTGLKIDDVQVAESAVPALAAGERKRLIFSYSYSCSPPGDVLQIIADNRSEIAESNENNNITEIFLTCFAFPDLIITDSWFQGNTLFYKIKNQGDEGSDASWTSLPD